ncbi:kinase-like protein [Clavulina sp. PMI_390]|nr:kinase-like protein [Clavulina sp. PMI_390]
MSCTYRSLTLSKLAKILPSLNQGVPDDRSFANPPAHHLNSWWYVIALLVALRGYRAHWTTPPSNKWASRAVAALNNPVARLLAASVSRNAKSSSSNSHVPSFRCLSVTDWVTPAFTTDRAWMSTKLSVDRSAVLSTRRILSDPQVLSLAMMDDYQEHALELLQDALDDPSDELGDDRPRAMRLLQDLVSRAKKLPQCIQRLRISKRVFRDAGGEALIWNVTLDNKPVIARDARPPDNEDWASPEGQLILSVVRREIVSQIQIRHPNVLPILGISSDNVHPLSIITPLAPNGNAFRYLLTLNPSDRGYMMLKIVTNVASAIDYLHQLRPPIVHGDIHARNILIDADGNGLLSDFGLSRIKHEQTRTATNIVEGGKYRYMAPELLSSLDRKFRTTPASDCYAFAMTILELATLEKPFAEFENERAAFAAAEHGVRPQRPAQEKFGGPNAEAADLIWALLTEMWDEQPGKRPTMYMVNCRLVAVLCLDPPLQRSTTT